MKNYLGKTKKVKAPLEWQSSSDSPPTQLAYVTQPEIDMLVEANIHNSMKGQPNMGPSGILSLDGGDEVSKEVIKKARKATEASPQARQRFRDRTGSDVVTDNEVKERQRLGLETDKAKLRAAPDKGYEDKDKIGQVDRDVKKEVTTFKGFNYKGRTKLLTKEVILLEMLKRRGLSDAAILMALHQAAYAGDELFDLFSGEGIGAIAKGIVSPGSLLKKKDDEDYFLGSAGGANVLKKLERLQKEGKDKEFYEYFDQVKKSDPDGFEKMFEGKADVDFEEFKKTIEETNRGNKNFDKAYNPETYYEVSPPMTSGEQENLARASMGPDFDWTKENTLMVQKARDELAKSNRGGLTDLASFGGGGGGGTTPTDPTDPTDPNQLATGTFLARQYNQNLVPDPNLDPYQNAMYTGGAEQMHLAGGYWDPATGQWVGSPWGTEDLWQGANPPMNVAEGGPIRAPSSKVTNGGGGLFNFKAYGF